MLQFDSMTGPEFEIFIYNIFTKLGFRAQLTKASGDGGIDLIAYYDGLVFKGKYLIQCKRWKGNVGEPELRDLYGTIVSENALKGILVTTSSFTKQAIEFSRGKNLELIDGVSLSMLIESISKSDDISYPIRTKSQIGFFSHNLFDKEKYSLFDSKIKSNPKLEIPQKALIQYLIESVGNIGAESLSNGLLDECLVRIDNYIELFAKGKTEKSKGIRWDLCYQKAFLLFIKGRFGEAYETLIQALSERNWISPNYSSMLYAISTILGITSLSVKHSQILKRCLDIPDTFGDRNDANLICSSVIQHQQNKNEEAFENIKLNWPRGEGYNLLTLVEIMSKFNTSFKEGIDEHRMILESYGEK
jgi:hypothetical protein